MDKEEVLRKSREENKKQDVYKKEVMRNGGNIAACVAAILATIFFVIQIFLGEGMNYGLYAVVFSIPATGFVYKAAKLHRKHEIVIAVAYVIIVLALSAWHIYNMFTSSEIL